MVSLLFIEELRRVARSVCFGYISSNSGCIPDVIDVITLSSACARLFGNCVSDAECRMCAGVHSPMQIEHKMGNRETDERGKCSLNSMSVSSLQIRSHSHCIAMLSATSR